MLEPLPEAPAASVLVSIDGTPAEVPAGISAAAALLVTGTIPTRRSLVTGAPRAPYCLMGVCFECLLEIDGIPNRQGCMVTVAEGMRIRRVLE